MKRSNHWGLCALHGHSFDRLWIASTTSVCSVEPSWCLRSDRSLALSCLALPSTEPWLVISFSSLSELFSLSSNDSVWNKDARKLIFLFQLNGCETILQKRDKFLSKEAYCTRSNYDCLTQDVSCEMVVLAQMPRLYGFLLQCQNDAITWRFSTKVTPLQKLFRLWLCFEEMKLPKQAHFDTITGCPWPVFQSQWAPGDESVVVGKNCFVNELFHCRWIMIHCHTSTLEDRMTSLARLSIES